MPLAFYLLPQCALGYFTALPKLHRRLAVCSRRFPFECRAALRLVYRNMMEASDIDLDSRRRLDNSRY